MTHAMFTMPRRQPALRLRRLRWILRALLALGLLLPGSAFAACWITSSPTFNFGSANAGGASTSASLQFTCDNYTNATLSYRVCVYFNPNPSTPLGVAPRRMINWSSANQLQYDIYANAGYTQIVGSELSGHAVLSAPLTLTSNGQANGSILLHARIPPSQSVSAGDYVSQNTSVLKFVSQAGNTPPTAAQCGLSLNRITNYTEAVATFANTCFIATATDMDFGSSGGLATARTSTSTISLRCPTGTAWQVGLNNGANAVGNTRRMLRTGGHYLAYELYRDAGYAQRWGDSLNTDTRTGTGTNANQALTVYGQVPAQAVTAAGAYSDTITVTLTY